MAHLETGVDRLLDLVRARKKISVDEAAKALQVEEPVIQDWAAFLKDEELIDVKYSLSKTFLLEHTLTEEETERKAEEVVSERESFLSKVDQAAEDLQIESNNFDTIRKEYESLKRKMGDLGNLEQYYQAEESYRQLRDDLTNLEKGHEEQQRLERSAASQVSTQADIGRSLMALLDEQERKVAAQRKRLDELHAFTAQVQRQLVSLQSSEASRPAPSPVQVSPLAQAPALPALPTTAVPPAPAAPVPPAPQKLPSLPPLPPLPALPPLARPQSVKPAAAPSLPPLPPLVPPKVVESAQPAPGPVRNAPKLPPLPSPLKAVAKTIPPPAAGRHSSADAAEPGLSLPHAPGASELPALPPLPSLPSLPSLDAKISNKALPDVASLSVDDLRMPSESRAGQPSPLQAKTGKPERGEREELPSHAGAHGSAGRMERGLRSQARPAHRKKFVSVAAVDESRRQIGYAQASIHALAKLSETYGDLQARTNRSLHSLAHAITVMEGDLLRAHEEVWRSAEQDSDDGAEHETL